MKRLKPEEIDRLDRAHDHLRKAYDDIRDVYGPGRSDWQDALAVAAIELDTAIRSEQL